MSRIAYVNGRYVRQSRATVNIEDRGYQFADGVYEVIAVAGGRLVDAARHFDRLERSLGELRIAMPCSRRALGVVVAELLRRNRLETGIVYLQITRGVAPRNHAFPARPPRPALVMTTARLRPPSADAVAHGVKVVTVPDNRWRRTDIKSVSLLPNVLAKQQAVEAGAYEAWFVDHEGLVTEGASTNAWIVNADSAVVTRPLSPAILAGITREAVIETAREAGFGVVERPFSVAEAKAAREAFVTSTTSFVLPVTAIDGAAVGDGRPGPVTRALLAAYAGRVGVAIGGLAATGEGEGT